MGSYGDAWLRCERCGIWGKCLRVVPPGVPALIDIDGLGGIICNPCYDRGPPRLLGEWMHWLRLQPRRWDIRYVRRGQGYEPIRVEAKATTKGNRDNGYAPTRGEANGGKGTAATGKGKGKHEDEWRRQTKGKELGQANGEFNMMTARDGEGGQAFKGQRSDGKGKGYKPSVRIYV